MCLLCTAFFKWCETILTNCPFKKDWIKYFGRPTGKQYMGGIYFIIPLHRLEKFTVDKIVFRFIIHLNSLRKFHVIYDDSVIWNAEMLTNDLISVILMYLEVASHKNKTARCVNSFTTKHIKALEFFKADLGKTTSFHWHNTMLSVDCIIVWAGYTHRNGGPGTRCNWNEDSCMIIWHLFYRIHDVNN